MRWPLSFVDLAHVVAGLKSICRPRKRQNEPPVLPNPVTEDASEESLPHDVEASVSEQSVLEGETESAAGLVGPAISEGQPAGTAPIFIGDRQGIGVLVEASNPRSANQRHLMVPRAAAKSLQPEDLHYLQIKGCFQLPSQEICIALVDCYFEHVHPTFPIINSRAFSEKYVRGGLDEINLLLVWSMFSVAASYIDDQILQETEFDTRKAMKACFVQRAKLLFDLSCEDDKIVLIQAVLLLSFWFADAEDVMQSWHWTGIAIGLSQTLGLHRNPDTTRKNTAIDDHKRQSWRQLWWSCVMRDCWLAMGMGRPLRINKDDCDCPMPTEEDIQSNFAEVALKGRPFHTAVESSGLAKLWIRLLELSVTLRHILSSRYRPNTLHHASTEMGALAAQINASAVSDTIGSSQSRVLEAAASHLRLYQNAALMVLFRTESSQYAKDKVQEFARSTNTIIERYLAEDNTRSYAGPTTVALLVPAMHAHLLAAKSKPQLTTQLGLHNLDLCLIFLNEMSSNYPAAGIVYRLFTAAKDQICRTRKDRHSDPSWQPTQQVQPRLSDLPTPVHAPSPPWQSLSLGDLERFMSLPVESSFFIQSGLTTDQ